MRALTAAGFTVTGIGRSLSAAMASDAAAAWLIRDIPSIDEQEWRRLIAGVDVVVNASGALQDGARDDLQAIHVTAIAQLVAAARGMPVRIVQISAAGASPEASTAFFRTKAAGDAILSAGAADWVILRPTLVLAREAYGGTALLRAAACLPLVQPRVLPNAEVQTVHIDYVAAAVVAAAKGAVPSGTIADMTEPEAHSFPDLVTAIRRWLGYGAPVWTPRLPPAVLSVLGWGADFLGRLGWRSPLRTTALRALAEGVRGDPGGWAGVGGAPCRTLAETLSDLQATRQDRIFARAYVVLPIAIATLTLFWCLSGLIALLDPPRAIAVLTSRGVHQGLAACMVIGGAAADVVLGLAILWRPWTRRAALGMIALSALYMVGSLLTAPDLWSDPLGPMVKVLPALALAAVVAFLMEDR